jgi:hypothetical protein
MTRYKSAEQTALDIMAQKFLVGTPRITTGGSLQPRGSKECGCGRTISANKEACLSCLHKLLDKIQGETE